MRIAVETHDGPYLVRWRDELASVDKGELKTAEDLNRHVLEVVKK